MDIKDILQVVERSIDNKNYKEALEVLDTVSELDPGYSICLFLKGNVYGLSEKYDLALENYRSALKHGLVAKELFYNMAITETELYHFDDACDHFRQAFEIDSSSIKPLSQIAQIRLWQGNFKGAEAIYEEMTELFPEKYEGFHYIADMLIGSEKIDEAEEFLVSLEDRFSGNAVYTYDRSRIMSKREEYEKAFRFLQNKRELFHAAETLEYMYKKACGRLLMHLEQVEDAMEIWVDLFENYGDKEAGTYLIAGAARVQEFELALETADRLLSYAERGAEHFLALYYKALLLHVLKREQESKLVYDQFEKEAGLVDDEKTRVDILSMQIGVSMLFGEKEKTSNLIEEIKGLLLSSANGSEQRTQEIEEYIRSLYQQAMIG